MSDQSLEQKVESYDEERRRKHEERQKREATKVKVTSKIEEKKATLHEKNEIPIIALYEDVGIETNEIKIDKEIPEIGEEELKISIPIIELEKPVIELKQVELEKIIPKIVAEERKFEIPLIKLNKPEQVRSFITTFDEKLPQIQPTVRILRVPIYRVSKSAVREIVSSFDSRIDPKILQCFIDKELEQKPETTSPESEPSAGEEEFEEIPDIVDFVFGVPNSKISSRGPKIVLYKELENDSTIGSFETLCIRIHREKEGGYPRIQPIKKFDDFNIREIEKWVEANKRVVTIDLDNDKGKARQWFCEDNLREPLRRTIIGDVGFIIFKTRDAELYEHSKKVLENLETETEHILDIVYAQPKPLSFEEKKKLSNLAWGYIKFDSISPFILEEKRVERPHGATFDDIFNKLSQRKFEDCLEELEGSPYSNATKPHDGEESKEHKRMKWFVVKYLTKKLKVEGVLKLKNPIEPKAFEINATIKTEEDTKKELDVCIADVMDTHAYEVYEIETLFAQDREGKTVEEKLNYTIEKYKKVSKQIEKINIVLDNLTLLTNLKKVVNVLKNKPKEEREKVEFYTIDLQNDELISLRVVIKSMGSTYSTKSKSFSSQL